jgi:hypothetical protein
VHGDNRRLRNLEEIMAASFENIGLGALQFAGLAGWMQIEQPVRC